MATLDDLKEGDIAFDIRTGDYAVVKDDSNGKWYSLIDENKLTEEFIHDVSDMDEQDPVN